MQKTTKTTWFLLALLAVVVAHAIYILLIGIGQPISDMHEFRQTQTALSIYWIWKDGHYLAYETPAVGYPWSIPFEFPLYEYFVVALREVGVPIIVGGRLVSFAFLLGMLWPLSLLFRALRLNRDAFLITAILLFASPIYVFWARTLMIETCAVFFGLAWLAFLARFLDDERAIDLIAAAIFGILATAAKSTTFPPFLLLGGFLICWFAYNRWRSIYREPWLATTSLATGACIIPLATGALWLWFSDHVKEANPIGTLLTSHALTGFTIGTWAQRWSKQLWETTILERVSPDVLGYGAVIAPFVLGATLTNRKKLTYAALSLVAFLIPFLLISNLHIIHNYYQTANAIFLIAAVGLGIAAILESGGTARASIALLAVVAGQLTFFHKTFAPVVTANYTAVPAIQIGAAVRRLTQPGEAIIVFGDDWSSAIPYYSERKALEVPFWVSGPILSGLLSADAEHVGPDKLGAIVDCAANLPNYLNLRAPIENFLAGRALLGEVAGCRILAPTRSR